jgi:hypothetical protein
VFRQKQPPPKLSRIETAAIRQSVWTKRRQDFNQVVRISVSDVEDGRGKQNCRAAFDNDARALTSILLR